jgi:phosphomethylpyrimidine synthase
MSTQIERARKGEISDEMRAVAHDEGVTPEFIREGVARGTIVIPKNRNHRFRAIGVGTGISTKVNANLGASSLHNFQTEEIEKLRIAIGAGAHSVMDLSTGRDLDEIRVAVLEECTVMLGTVPIYQVASEETIVKWTTKELFAAIEKQAKQGVDFMTLHAGVTKESIRHLRGQDRVEGIVSRGGSIHAAWIHRTGEENPLYERFDELCDILREYDVTFSLGDGLRPGALADANDRGQIAEMLVLGELTKRAREKGCQVMIEGPGHVPIDQIAAVVHLEKRVCDGAPFYVLGPLTADVAPGYDHITGAIGGAIASAAGADFLCYVTPAEHLRLPDKQDVLEGVIATRIAAHSGDIGKKIPRAREWDDAMSRYRKALDWPGMYRLAMDPEKARRYKEGSEAAGKAVCTMCGSLCSINIDNHTHRPEAVSAAQDVAGRRAKTDQELLEAST